MKNLVIALGLGAVAWYIYWRAYPSVGSLAPTKSTIAQTPPPLIATPAPKPTSLKELLALPPSEMAKVDIARSNLLCAIGLQGSEHLTIQEIEGMETMLDAWADHIKHETSRNFHRFREDPANFNNSEAYFRMMLLTTVLQENYHIHYNPARIYPVDKPEPSQFFYADSKDVFLNGLIGPRAMGTCSSMPVLYVAVARRLGYPVKLGQAKAHWFVRWEDPKTKERFDVEATGRGFLAYDDDEYRKWPYPITAEEEKAGYYLQSLTPLEEIAACLQIRANCLIYARYCRPKEARVAIQESQKLAPEWPMYPAYYDFLDYLDAKERSRLDAETDAATDRAIALSDARRQAMAGLPPELPYSPPNPYLANGPSPRPFPPDLTPHQPEPYTRAYPSSAIQPTRPSFNPAITSYLTPPPPPTQSMSGRTLPRSQAKP